MSGRPNLQEMRAKLAETAEQQGSKLDEAIASQPDRSKAAKIDAPIAVPAAKVEKRSTSLYLSGAASRAIKGLAVSRGVRPHRIVDEALAEYLAKPENGGLDFHGLNAKD
ncbi:MAG: hypothetical protein MIN69_22160 [Methylorubrum extorquens]|jgi:hypothetical protein|uniref:hypothetical protein n=1 Tax=Methylobacteriaceae TaxID=119045 RepID=UPI0019D1556A|nr:hypothetical protein [Methylobacterium organophilum]MBN6824116.1 hypothetical protein [Methylobacterium organophilum]